MKRIIFSGSIFLLVWMAIPGFANPDTISYGNFGKIRIYKPSGPIEAVVLFVSGDGGWNSGVIDMAGVLSSLNALTVGIDIVRYYRNTRKSSAKCYYPASDFENLSIYIQKKYHIAQYMKPILVGYSSGATLVYAMLVQAPANTFKGAISLGFCPDIEINKPLCEGAGLKSSVLKPGKSYWLEAAKNLSAPFIVLHGMADSVCDHRTTNNYIKGMQNAELVSLPKVGHGFSVRKNWVPQFKEAFKKVMEAPVFYENHRQTATTLPSASTKSLFTSISRLPLVTYPAPANVSQPLVIMISGDGGWTGWDQSLSEEFVKHEIPVIGLDAQKYFWDEKKPGTVTLDITNILKFYMAEWNKSTFILLGYSFGADVVPFIASRLDSPYSGQITRVVMLSPDPKADFEIHLTDMLNLGIAGDDYDVVKEVRKLQDKNVLCIFGESEDNSDKQPFGIPHVKVVNLPGSHHFKDNFPLIVETVLKK
jgi:type IV secretory pathway VirJ component